jgi:hypothetical protein
LQRVKLFGYQVPIVHQEIGIVFSVYS